jgi:hypothetical protein
MTVSTPGSGERSPEATGSQPGGEPRRLVRVERNVVAVSTAMFAMALGEQTWRRFLPKYLQTLGAPIVAIGAYGTAEDFLDGIYQYPGVWIADHYRRRRALLLFVGLAGIGYAIIAVAPVWPVVVLGLVFTMAWTSMASPSFFAVIGDALPLAFIVGGLREIGEPARKALTWIWLRPRFGLARSASTISFEALPSPRRQPSAVSSGVPCRRYRSSRLASSGSAERRSLLSRSTSGTPDSGSTLAVLSASTSAVPKGDRKHANR